MDDWKYYGITHRAHVMCNPTSDAKLDELLGFLRLEAGARVLDIACGKAEFLCRMAERHGIQGVGVDLSPYESKVARAKIAARGLGEALEFVEGDAAAYEGAPASFDVSLCLGASWIWEGLRGTLRALAGWTRPGGFVISGEPFLAAPIPAEADVDPAYRAFIPHHENVAIAEEEGLRFHYAWVSSPDEWDRYIGLQSDAAERYAREQPDDPDLPALLARVRLERDRYLRWERDAVGWAIYLLRKPG